VIFNRGSAEPKGFASICQGFRSWSLTKIKMPILQNLVRSSYRSSTMHRMLS